MERTDTKKSLTVRQPKDTELFTYISDKQAIRLLKDAVKARKQAQYPNIPQDYLTCHNYEGKTANGLTRCVIDYINSQEDCHAERISNEGVMRTDKNGKSFRATSSMTNGTADIHATIVGRSVKFEIKIGRDVQSAEQKQYQQDIENAKGYYLIVRNFEEFLTWFLPKMEQIKAKKGVKSE